MDDVQHAITVLNEGGIVIYPTDTAFGIGCRIDNADSVDRLFRIRRRPTDVAMPVLVGSFQMALPYLDSPKDIVRRLAKKYWPGALTIVALCNKDSLYSPIRGGGNTVGLRMPDQEIPLAMIGGIGVPILGPSANFHGQKTPYRYKDLDPEIIKNADYVVPGEGIGRIHSTVLDTTTHPMSILRQGALILPVTELR